MANLLQSETDFGLNLLRQQDTSKSLVFSPLSISLGLSLAHAGAKGETRDEIRNALLKGATDNELKKLFATISARCRNAKEKTCQVYIANSVFIRNNLPVEEPYVNDIEKLYNAGVIPLDFNDQKSSAKAINDFVSDNTNKNIKNIISPGEINEGVMMIMANALYFKADWFRKFTKAATRDDNFFVSAKEKKVVQFLSDSYAYNNYGENREFQVLTLPYMDKTFAMNIFLPKQRFGLEAAIKNLDGATVQHLLSNSSKTYMHVKIPKWKTETTFKLNKALNALGIKKAFETSADLSNISAGTYITGADHVAIIEVDEDGTTAAAWTRLYGGGGPLAEPEINFTADHPFLYILTKDNHPMFIGLHL